MKRDMELIRLLLLEVEGEDKPDLSKYSEEQQVYHMALLIEADLIKGAVVENEVGYPCNTQAIRLTWTGHEFLDSARNPSVWNKVMTKMKSDAASLPLAIVQELLTSILKNNIGLET